MCVAAHGFHGFRVPDVLGARDELVVLVGGDVSEGDELKRSGRVAFSQYQGVGVARSDSYRQDLWGRTISLMSRSHDFLALLATITHGRGPGALAQGTVWRAAIVAQTQSGRCTLEQSGPGEIPAGECDMVVLVVWR